MKESEYYRSEFNLDLGKLGKLQFIKVGETICLIASGPTAIDVAIKATEIAIQMQHRDGRYKE